MGYGDMHEKAFMTWHACVRERERKRYNIVYILYLARHAWDSTHWNDIHGTALKE